MAEETKNVPAVTYYTPVELVGIYRSFLERGKSNGVVWLRGIYIQRPNQISQWIAFYDELRDVDSNTTITLKINRQDRTRLKPNSLVQIGGLIELNPFANGTIQIVVAVTRFEIIKDQFVTEQDIKRSEIRIAKTKRGFKNVDAVLEDKLFRDERPRVALVFASTSITMADFNAGVNAAAVKIDFVELRQSFGNGKQLSLFLRQQDQQKYDTIALIRGGGSGIEALDDIEVLQSVSEMQTPLICAIGHVGEELFLKSIADKVAPTPNGLGQYFSEMVERVAEKRNNSRAALVEEVRKQFLKQIEDANKKNKELQEKLQQLNKTMELTQKQHKEQIEAANKLNKDLQEQLKAIQKANQEQIGKLDASHKAQLKQLMDSQTKLQEQLKQQQQDFNKRSEEANKTINEMTKQQSKMSQETIALQKQLAEAKAGESNTIYIVIIVILIALLIISILF